MGDSSRATAKGSGWKRERDVDRIAGLGQFGFADRVREYREPAAGSIVFKVSRNCGAPRDGRVTRTLDSPNFDREHRAVARGRRPWTASEFVANRFAASDGSLEPTACGGSWDGSACPAVCAGTLDSHGRAFRPRAGCATVRSALGRKSKGGDAGQRNWLASKPISLGARGIRICAFAGHVGWRGTSSAELLESSRSAPWIQFQPRGDRARLAAGAERPEI